MKKSAAQTAITQHFAPSAGARRGATHNALIAHQERTCARKKRLGNGSMFDSHHCCRHLSRNSHSNLRPASGTPVGTGQAVGDAVYLVCKAFRSSNTPIMHSFEVLAASGDLARAVDSARQTFCETTKLQVQFTQYFGAQLHGNSVRPAWKASNVFASPEPRGVAQACCGFCGRVFAEGPDISPELLPEIWAPPVAAGTQAYQSEWVRSLLSMCSRPYTRHTPSHVLTYTRTRTHAGGKPGGELPAVPCLRRRRSMQLGAGWGPMLEDSAEGMDPTGTSARELSPAGGGEECWGRALCPEPPQVQRK